MALNTAVAQDVRYCGQTEATEAFFSRFPAARTHAHSHVPIPGVRQADGEVYVIPIVFHLIHNNGAENIGNDQIMNALEILNRDMRKQNADTIVIADAFAPLASDTHIEFRLAQKDPNGNCHSGINRVVSSQTYEGDYDMKQLSNWPRDSYLNVWICADANGAAGYSQLPENVDGPWGSSSDGIVMRHDYTGAIGTSNNTRSRALTHEVGHWLGLPHTWGAGNSPGESNNCDMDDGVDDTPLTLGWTSCPVNGESCGSADNIQNYMEYSYCSRMYTQGQADEMVYWATSSTADRNELWTDANREATGTLSDVAILCAAAFSPAETVVCVGDVVQFEDLSYHTPISWAWDFGDGTTLSGSTELEADPSHVYTEAGMYDVTLTVGNGIDEVTVVVTGAVNVLEPGMDVLPFTEGFEEDTWEDLWFVTNPTNDQGWNETETGYAIEGDRCIRLSNNLENTEDTYDWFESSTFDASNDSVLYLNYSWSYVNRVQETDDRLRIYVSGDCGQNWSLRKLHRGFTDLPTGPAQNSAWAPNGPEDWTDHTIVLDQEQWMTGNMRVKFEFQAKGGNNLFIDKINLLGQSGVGIQTSAAYTIQASVYPNPTQAGVTLSVDAKVGDQLQVCILDAQGREIEAIQNWNVTSGNNTVHVPLIGAAPGWYVVTARGDSGFIRLPLLVK